MAAGRDDVAVSLGELPTPGFTIFDVRTYWQVNDSWLVSAGVENFGDRLYRAHLDPISGNLLGVGPLFRPGTNFYFASQLTYSEAVTSSIPTSRTRQRRMVILRWRVRLVGIDDGVIRG